MKGILACAASVAMAYASEAGAQGQVVLSTCLSVSEPTCKWTEAAILGGLPGCHKLFVTYYGRIAFWNGSMVNRGDIQIDIETRRSSGAIAAPIYIEIVPTRFPETRPCEDALGYVVGVMNGVSGEVCEGFETIGPIDISGRVPFGHLYALRITFENNPDWWYASVFVDCVRITSFPVGVAPLSWGSVKTLYR